MKARGYEESYAFSCGPYSTAMQHRLRSEPLSKALSCGHVMSDKRARALHLSGVRLSTGEHQDFVTFEKRQLEYQAQALKAKRRCIEAESL